MMITRAAVPWPAVEIEGTTAGSPPSIPRRCWDVELARPVLVARTVEDWWEEIETDLINALATGQPVALGDVARKIGMSEAATTSLLCSLAQQGKVRIRLVELV